MMWITNNNTKGKAHKNATSTYQFAFVIDVLGDVHLKAMLYQQNSLECRFSLIFFLHGTTFKIIYN